MRPDAKMKRTTLLEVERKEGFFVGQDLSTARETWRRY